jgi:hypothetical protein
MAKKIADPYSQEAKYGAIFGVTDRNTEKNMEANKEAIGLESGPHRGKIKNSGLSSGRVCTCESCTTLMGGASRPGGCHVAETEWGGWSVGYFAGWKSE